MNEISDESETESNVNNKIITLSFPDKSACNNSVDLLKNHSPDQYAACTSISNIHHNDEEDAVLSKTLDKSLTLEENVLVEISNQNEILIDKVMEYASISANNQADMVKQLNLINKENRTHSSKVLSLLAEGLDFVSINFITFFFVCINYIFYY